MTDKENCLEIMKFGKPEKIISDLPLHNIAFPKATGFDELPGKLRRAGDRWTDIWGIGYHKEHDDFSGYPCEHPLSGPEKLATYSWPDPEDERIWGLIFEQHEAYQDKELMLSGGHGCLLWELAYKMVGMEDLMVYFYTEPEFVREIFHRIMDFQLGMAKHFLHLGVESVGLSEDLGTQHGPMFSPELMEEFFLPEYRRIFALYNQHNVLTGLHCCGHVETYLDMFIELGLKSLNPVQVTANDREKVRA